MENKYKTQGVVNRCLEEKILELMAGRPIHSPDTSSCHEVQVATTDRSSVATHSPLSLASPDGDTAADTRNSQVSPFRIIEFFNNNNKIFLNS